jgi:hypothetical protein
VRGQGRGRRGAPPRGGAGNTSRTVASEGDESPPARLRSARLAIGGRALRESARKQGRCPTVACGGLIDRSRWRTVGSRPHGQSSSLANTSGQAASTRGRTGHGLAPVHVRSREDRTRGMLEQALEGESPGEHRPRRPTIPGQGRVVARTDSRGEQSFEAGVPAAESGEPGPIRGIERRTRAGQPVTRDALATPGNRRPGYSVRRAARPAVASGRRDRRKGPRTPRTVPRRWAVEREPARKQVARESGYGSSRRESSVGRLQRARAA